MKAIIVRKGGPGSGHYGHSGLPGVWGGSRPGGVGTAAVGPIISEGLKGGPTFSKSTTSHFAQKLRQALSPKYRHFVTQYTAKEYNEMKARTFVSKSGNSGYAIKPDGDVISVFSKSGSGEGKYALASAISNGGTKLDCFDGFLPQFYQQFGFKEYDRWTWDDQFAPESWNYQKFDSPDVVLMELSINRTKSLIFKMNSKQKDNLEKLQREYVDDVFGGSLTPEEKEQIQEIIKRAQKPKITQKKTNRFESFLKEHSGMMVAWFVPMKLARIIRHGQWEDTFPPDSRVEKPEDYHITIAYMESTKGLENVKEIVKGITRKYAPFELSITGAIERFEKVEDGSVDAVYASIQSEALSRFREKMVGALGGRVKTNGKGYTPHITLAYIPTGAKDNAKVSQVDVTIGEIHLAVNGEVFRYPLSGEKHPRLIRKKGGSGSGHHGHSGLVGVWGGSTPGKGGGKAAAKPKATITKKPVKKKKKKQRKLDFQGLTIEGKPPDVWKAELEEKLRKGKISKMGFSQEMQQYYEAVDKVRFFNEQYDFGRGGINPEREISNAIKEGEDPLAHRILNQELSRGGWADINVNREEIKDEIVRAISEDTGIPYEDVNKGIRQWAESSNDEDMRSLSLQEAASEEFGVSLSEWQQEIIRVKGIFQDAELNHFESIARKDPALTGSSDELYKNVAYARSLGESPGFYSIFQKLEIGDNLQESSAHARNIERTFLSSMYSNTQDHFQEMGLTPDTRIRLFRGFTTDENYSKSEILNYEGNAIESWSVSKREAEMFGDTVISIWVPLKNIVGTARTGFGCITEGEIIILGSVENEVEVIYGLGDEL